MLTLIRRLAGRLGRSRPMGMGVGEKISPDTEGQEEGSDALVTDACRPAEEQDKSPRTHSTRHRRDEGMLTVKDEIVDYSLTDETSEDGLEIVFAHARSIILGDARTSGSSAVAQTRTILRSKTFEKPIASSSKVASSSKASIAGAGKLSKAKPVARARSTISGSHITRSVSSATSLGPTTSMSLDTPECMSKGRITKAVLTGKDAVLCYMMKDNQTVMRPCALGKSYTTPPRTTGSSLTDSRAGGRRKVGKPGSSSVGTKKSRSSSKPMEVQVEETGQPHRKTQRKGGCYREEDQHHRFQEIHLMREVTELHRSMMRVYQDGVLRWSSGSMPKC